MTAHNGNGPGQSAPKPSLTEEAYARIKTQILNNRLPPGFQALEPELAQRLGMSRTPVREALIRLREDGLVEIIRRRGMRVLPVSPDDMREIYEALCCIESEAAALLAARQPPPDTAPLDRAMAEMEQALEKDDLDAWAVADNDYHRAVVGLCGNSRLAAIAVTLQNQAHRARMFTLRLREKPVRSTSDHRDQVEAIAAGDSDGVRRMFRAHRQRAAEELLDILERFRLHSL
ncbi:MAG: GntR family transcriptional regulator [Rhodospirillales bacterium]|nr:GntR family transcriptional regulator [Rhodospirillales bacterium]